MERKEAVELLLITRNFLYSLLYKAFGREPDEAFLDLLTAENTGQCFSLLGGAELEAVPAFLAELRRAREDAAFPDRLKEEYTRLFVGPLELKAPPWESVYVGDGGMLFQESTLEVRACYRRFGLLPEAYPRVADDSLALELGFMAALSQRSADAFAQSDSAALKETLQGALDFLNAHLLVWIPKYLEKLESTPTDRLYPHLARILYSFLKKDRETLIDITTEGEHAHD